MTTQHTPGPLAALPKPNGNVAVIRITAPSFDVARFYGNEARANAELFITAPETAAERDRLREENAELLGALESVIAWWESETTPPERRFFRAAQAARAAVTKATKGEQHDGNF